MVNPVYIKSYTSPPYNVREILRYAGVKAGAASVEDLLDECIKEADGKLLYKVCYIELPVKQKRGEVDLGFTSLKSTDLATNLQCCSRIVLFAATVGVGIDRLIARYSSTAPSKALMLQAIGAERVESLCDLFEKEIKDEYCHTKPRFSPGYGDFSLQFQRDIFNLLDCSKKIGIALNDSLLISPSKSVTAIIGISNTEYNGQEKCGACTKQDCEFRRE